MEEPTELSLPQYFSYPITIVSLDAEPGSDVQRGTRLLSYSFQYQSKDPNSKPETRFGTWDSTIEGTLHTWHFNIGQVISSSRAREQPAVEIVEPCKHGMQHGGLCVLCGKDMTNVDYTGFSDASRASIQMTHSAFGPTVSFEEAQRIERETANHLLNARKLSLIVDLDQTIVHATVDPTVGEWIAEGEAWEAEQERRKAKDPEDSDSSDDDDDEEECNPNWEALKDVKNFTLGPEVFASPSRNSKGKQKMVEYEGAIYYIKPRPGWKEFLEEASTKYEMHVYTMGTRAYAEKVCAAIDPDGKIFGNRLLSRDESGSLTQKSLQRLFPCDTSMVVIIDDRADVWEWSPNLLKVIPYDFFVGIGDINSTFLPKLDAASLLPGAKESKPTTSPPAVANGSDPSTTATKPSTAVAAAAPVADADANASSKDLPTEVLVTENIAALEAQVEERPLAKAERELQEHETHAEQSVTPSGDGKASKSPTPEAPVPHHRKALLKNDDVELQRIGKLLNEVHSRFYAGYDARSPESDKRKTAPGSRSYDVTRIIPRIRTEALEGCHIIFSGLIPLDTKPETTEIWRSASMFGARCYTDLNKQVTHVVAAKLGTAKVDMARKRGGIKIVSAGWLQESIAQWQRADERPYLLDPSSSTTAGSSTSSPLLDDSQDPEKDGDIWEEAETKFKDAGGLELTDVDWGAVNDEVDAAMMESDDDDEEDDEEDWESKSNMSTKSEEWDDAVEMTSPVDASKPSRKRLRSVTPSEGIDDLELLRSPLSKRKKVAAERTGASRLKEGISADDIITQRANGSRASSRRGTPSVAGDDEDEDVGGDDDDWLLRELEEEEEEGEEEGDGAEQPR